MTGGHMARVESLTSLPFWGAPYGKISKHSFGGELTHLIVLVALKDVASIDLKMDDGLWIMAES